MIGKAALLLFFILCCAPAWVIGQPTGGGPGTPPDVPLTGIELLIAAGGFLGLRSLLKKKGDGKD